MVIVPADTSVMEEAALVAKRWGLSVGEAPPAGHYLLLTRERLSLCQAEEEAGPVYADFAGGSVDHRRRFGGGRGQPIAKAAGLTGGATPSILDATAGLGRDAFVYASLGCHVTLVERSPIAAALLEDGLRRAGGHADVAPIVERMRLVHADALHYLEQLREGERPDVVYLDPMFPHREKSALVKKEMRSFQAVIGADADSERLLEAALNCARVRVVVKRPGGAPPLAGLPPTVTYPTKNQRFDVYVIKALAR